jgi:hypothetical protein
VYAKKGQKIGSMKLRRPHRPQPEDTDIGCLFVDFCLNLILHPSRLASMDTRIGLTHRDYLQNDFSMFV